jgi:hypothetical protein
LRSAESHRWVRERVARDWFCPTLLLFSDKASSQCTVSYDVTEGLKQVSERGNANDADFICLAMAFLDDTFRGGFSRTQPSSTLQVIPREQDPGWLSAAHLEWFLAARARPDRKQGRTRRVVLFWSVPCRVVYACVSQAATVMSWIMSWEKRDAHTSPEGRGSEPTQRVEGPAVETRRAPFEAVTWEADPRRPNVKSHVRGLVIRGSLLTSGRLIISLVGWARKDKSLSRVGLRMDSLVQSRTRHQVVA